MENKKEEFEISCGNVLCTCEYFGKELGYLYTGDCYTHPFCGKKVDAFLLTATIPLLTTGYNIYIYKSILDGHKMVSFDGWLGLKKDYLKDCKLTSPLSPNGYPEPVEKCLGYAKNEKTNYLTCFIYEAPETAKNGYSILKPKEEQALDKLLNSHHITSQNILLAKSGIERFNKEHNRRYQIMLKKTLEIEKIGSKEQKLARKKELKAERQNRKNTRQFVKEITQT